MKYKLTKAEFEALTDEAQAEYTLEGDAATLKIEGDDAPTMERIEKLEQKRKIEAEHTKKAELKLKDADERAAKLQKDLENAGDNKGEIAKIKEAHATELEGMRKERAEESAKVKANQHGAMIRDEASSFAAKNFVDAPYGAEFIASQISKRLSVEEVDGVPVVRVVNADGTPSTAAIADLHKEFLDNTEFSPIIKAKAGSGGGATNSGQGGGATSKKISEMTATEEAAMERDHPEQYAAALATA